jgi:trans-2,3-dihydro-3-hydroxyanthranilate isomerase
MQVDAFTEVPLEGNPCAVVFGAEALTEAQMLAVAREMNLSETAFVLPSEIADVRARYFTPAEEIPLAGHPTIATVFALVKSGRLPLAGEHTRIQLELQVGTVAVDIEAEGGQVRQIVMSQKEPEFFGIYEAAEIMPVFGLRPADARQDAPIQTVSTGTPQLMVPLQSLDALRRARLDGAAYAALRQQGDFFSPHLFVLEGFTEAGQTAARHFGVPPDLAEDPFTGSATGGMAAYLWRYGLLAEPRFVAEQGHWQQRPGRAMVEVVGTRQTIETVRVGGPAVMVAEGTMYL